MRAARVRSGIAAGVATLALTGWISGCGSSSAGPGSPTVDDTTSAAAGISFPPTGNQYVDARRCPACHQGPNPDSTGHMAGALTAVPGSYPQGVALFGPNLTPDPTTGIGNWNDDQISTAILSGIDNMGERLCPQMQHFPDMQMDELSSILGYLHSLPPVMHQASASHCPPLKP